MLAVTRLLFHLRTFYRLHLSRMALTLVCNSLSLLASKGAFLWGME
jgi:hypothetical protein